MSIDEELTQKHQGKNINNSCICEICPDYCTIDNYQAGQCGVISNQNGRLVDLGTLAAAGYEPIEKKPIFHFYPGSLTYSIGLRGCHLACSFCRNYELSQGDPRNGTSLPSPEGVVESAIKGNARIICFTFTEPLVHYKFVIQVSKLAREQGLKTVLLTSGYASERIWNYVIAHVDAVKIDIKGIDESTYKENTRGSLLPVVRNIKTAINKEIWVECSLLIRHPSLSSEHFSLQAIEILQQYANEDTPVHIQRFFPSARSSHEDPGNLVELSRISQYLMLSGMKYVYGDLLGNDCNVTICPKCQTLLVARSITWNIQNHIRGNHCPKCNSMIAGRW